MMDIIKKCCVCSILTFSILFLSTSYAQDASFKGELGLTAVPNQFIVRTTKGSEDESISALLAGASYNALREIPLIGAQLIETTELTLSELVNNASGLPNVSLVEPNYLYYLTADPNDPEYSTQWGFPKIEAQEAWDKRTTSDDIVVAVVDTGIDYNHPDLAGNMWKNPGEVPDNGVDDDGNGIVDDVFGARFNNSLTEVNGDPMDGNGHGTHVAGTIGAVTDNNLGVAGVNWSTKLMGVKIFSDSGSTTLADILAALQYAIDMQADVMNNSWGGGAFSQALKDMITEANNAGILFVAAAGNFAKDNDATPFYPSSYDVSNIVSVMATNKTDEKANFSHYGATSVDIGAPGVDILSTVPGGGYASFNGTSMASPHVAGAAAMVLAENPGMTVDALKKKLLDTAEKIPTLEGLSVSGARLNLNAAISGVGDSVDCGGDTHAQIAYEQILWSDGNEYDSNSNVLSVDYNLSNPMIVEFEVNASATRTEGSGNTTVRTGVYSLPGTNSMWTGSYRKLTFNDTVGSQILSSKFALNMPAGDHEVFWKLWINNAKLKLDSGSITARAFPCSMGGKFDQSDFESTSITKASSEPNIQVESLGQSADVTISQ